MADIDPRLRALTACALLCAATFTFVPSTSASIITDYDVSPIPGTFVPLDSSATVVTLADDEVTFALGLGFTTEFWGVTTSEFWIGSNGFVTMHFQTPAGCCQGQPLPSRDGVDGVIAGYWTDLFPQNGGTIRFQRFDNLSGEEALVVEYDGVPVSGGGAATFQVVVFESGVFDIRYDNATAGATTVVSAGAENRDATRGIELARGTNVSFQGEGFRFTPFTTEVPDPQPVIDRVTPSEVAPGDTIRIDGSGFVTQSAVFIGGVRAPSFTESNTTLFAGVPGLPEGPHPVTVLQPDGKETTLGDALFVVDRFAIHDVTPRSAVQSQEIRLFGSGFTPSTAILFDDTLIESVTESRNLIRATVPATLPPDLYSVTAVDPGRDRMTLHDVLVVRGAPDVAVAITAERDHVTTDAATVGLPGGWSVTVTLTNIGEGAADAAGLEVVAAPADGTLRTSFNGGTRTVGFDFFDMLAPGRSVERTFHFGDVRHVGEYNFRATVDVFGAPDRNPFNNEASTSSYFLVGGQGGIDATPPELDTCQVPVFFCQPLVEERHVTHRHQDATDTHEDASLRVDARMTNAEFDFANFPVVFDTTSEDVDGTVSECRTWRFFGGGGGTFAVQMRPGNGLDGVIELFAEASRTNGTARTESWNETRVAGVIIQESERDVNESAQPEPRNRYEFPDPETQWTLHATGLTGDFTRCTVDPPGDAPHEEFTFAALPANTDEPEPSFQGSGRADLVEVDYVTEETTHTSRSVLL